MVKDYKYLNILSYKLHQYFKNKSPSFHQGIQGINKQQKGINTIIYIPKIKSIINNKQGVKDGQNGKNKRIKKEIKN